MRARWIIPWVLFAMPANLLAQRVPRGEAKPAPKITRSIANAAIISEGGSLSLELTSAPAGAPLAGNEKSSYLDLGKVSSSGIAPSNVQIQRGPNSFVVRTSFGLALRDPSGHSQYATVSGYVPVSNDRVLYRIDGKKLSTNPIVVAAHARVGIVKQHTLEIEVPNSLTEREAQIFSAIQFSVVVD